MAKKKEYKNMYVLNKMPYPVKFILDIDSKKITKYQRILGKSELGPFTMTEEVLNLNKTNPNIEIFKN